MSGQYRDPRADDLLRRYHHRYTAPELPVPVEAIAEDLLGLAVAERDDLEVSGLLLPAQREIWLNATEIPARRRFTLAHELGHWICQAQQGQTAPLYCRTTDLTQTTDRALEKEANVFAAELLMPEPRVRPEYPQAADIPDLATRFGVSGEAMHWRLYSFGLVETGPV